MGTRLQAAGPLKAFIEWVSKYILWVFAFCNLYTYLSTQFLRTTNITEAMRHDPKQREKSALL